MEYPISLDTALQIVGSMKAKAINAKVETSDQAQREKLTAQIFSFLQEERILYGGDERAKLQLMDKILKVYSPFLKKLYGYKEHS